VVPAQARVDVPNVLVTAVLPLDIFRVTHPQHLSDL
jgi:hypothetical protein